MKANIDAEQAVIGAVILDAEKVLPKAVLELQEDDFFVPELRKIFSVCLSLWREKGSADAVTVIAELGPEYRGIILNCSETVPTLAHVDFYINAVKTTAQKIRASESAQELVTAIEVESVEECRARAAEITKLLMGGKQIETFDAKAGFLDFVERRKTVRSIPFREKRVYPTAGQYHKKNSG